MRKQRLVYAEFVEHKPFRAVVLREEDGKVLQRDYAIEFCRFDQSHRGWGVGAGGFAVHAGQTYWAAADFPVTESPQDGPFRRLKRLPRAFPAREILRIATDESHCEYCPICDDWFPEWAECEHIFDCEECDEFVNWDAPCEHWVKRYGALISEDLRALWPKELQALVAAGVST